MSKVVIQQKFRQFIQSKLDESKKVNPRVSMRSFAKKLNISSGALSELLHGKRYITTRFANDFLRKLNIDPSDLAVKSMFERSEHDIEIYKDLSLTEYQLISDSLHFSLLALSKTKDFNSNLQWISKRLNRSENDVDQAINNLIKLKLLRKDETTLVATGHSIKSPDDISLDAIKKSHEQTMDDIRESLYDHCIEDRDLTSVTLALSKSLLPEVKKLVRKFHEDVAHLTKEDEPDEVYKIAIQVIPMSKSIELL